MLVLPPNGPDLRFNLPVLPSPPREFLTSSSVPRPGPSQPRTTHAHHGDIPVSVTGPYTFGNGPHGRGGGAAPKMMVVKRVKPPRKNSESRQRRRLDQMRRFNGAEAPRRTSAHMSCVSPLPLPDCLMWVPDDE